MPFDDDDGMFDGGADAEEPESPTSPSLGRSKNKAKARNGIHEGEDVEEEIARDLHDVETQQEDEDEDPTPKKKPKEKRPRKRAVDIPCKKPFAVAQPSC